MTWAGAGVSCKDQPPEGAASALPRVPGSGPAQTSGEGALGAAGMRLCWPLPRAGPRLLSPLQGSPRHGAREAKGSTRLRPYSAASVCEMNAQGAEASRVQATS